ncbi:hypothetical protein ACQZV8_06360 [Magnetococcales bacterium HHB-1]
MNPETVFTFTRALKAFRREENPHIIVKRHKMHRNHMLLGLFVRYSGIDEPFGLGKITDISEKLTYIYVLSVHEKYYNFFSQKKR